MKKIDEKTKVKANKLAIKEYIAEMRYNWRFSYSAIFFTAVGTIFITFIPTYVIAKLIGRIAGDSNLNLTTLLSYVGIAGIIWLVGEGLWRLAYFLESRASSRGIQNMYEKAFAALLKKDNDFFNNNFAGSLTKNVNGFARNYERFYTTIALDVSPNLIPILFAAVVLAFYSPWLSLILLGMIAITCVLAIPLIKERSRLVMIREESSTALTGHVADVIGNASTVRGYAHEAKEDTAHKNNVIDFVTKLRRSWDYQTLRVDMVLAPMYVLTNVLGLLAVVILGKQSGTLSVEAVALTFGYFSQATRALFQFNFIYRNLETSVNEAAQFTQYLLEEPKIIDTSHTALKATKGAVAFNNVTFTYDDAPDDHVFTNFNLTIKPGESIGLVGHSGSGKTTITKLLLRFSDIDSGEITIDGQNIAEVTQQSLRSAISSVPQEPIMFHRTISDNIGYGKLDATEDEIITAAKRANAHEFIIKLPNGYDTYVGERGIKLSGGQRQRIAIARAIIKDAPILILDEATSALDSESESLIQAALRELMRGKTAIVIAHRLSTIQKMDRIVVLEDGKIMEEGSHHELLKNNGPYAQLWAHQSGGFIE